MNPTVYQKIIVTLDGSALAECVLPHVEIIASACPTATVELLRVVPNVEFHHRSGVPISDRDEKLINEDALAEAENYLGKIKAGLEAKGIRAVTKALAGPVFHTMTEYIEKSGADLIIISTHGRSGPSRWVWGSVADRLLHSVCVPMLMVRAPGCFPGL